MTTNQAAEYLGVTRKALEGWRYKKEGPDYVKMGGLVRYEKDDLDKWVESNKVTAKA